MVVVGTARVCLPREGFLAEINIPLSLALAHCATELIGQTARSASGYGGGTDALLHLLVDQRVDIGTSREHLNAGGWGVDLLGAAGTGDEQQDFEDLTAAGHGENVGHPGPDPFEMLRRLDDPDKSQAAGGGSAVGVSGYDLAHLGYLMRDTNTCCPKHDSSIRVKVLTAVRTLHECRSSESTGRRQISLLVKRISETCSSADDEGHAGLALLEDVLAVQGETLLVAVHVSDVEVLLLVAPGQGEGVVGPESHRRHVEVSVLSRAESPGAGHANGDAEGIAGQDLDLGLGATLSKVAVCKAKETKGAFDRPDGNDPPHHGLLRFALGGLQVNPDTGNCDGCHDDVYGQEGLVEGVADGTGGLEQDEEEGSSSDGASVHEFRGNQALEGLVPAALGAVCALGHVSNDVAESLEYNDTSNPAVDQVHGVKGKVGKHDDWVVASCEQKERDAVHDRHDTGTVAEGAGNGCIVGVVVVDPPEAESNVGRKVAQQHEGLQTAGKGTDIDGGRNLELTVVPLSEEGGIEKMPAEVGENGGRGSEEPLGLVVQAGDGTDVADEVEDDVIQGEGGHKGIPDSGEVMLDIDVVLLGVGGTFLGSSSSTGGAVSALSSGFSPSHDLAQDVHGGVGHG